MRPLLQFLAVSGAIAAFVAGTLLVGLWALGFADDQKAADAASSFFWSVFWPILWLYRVLTDSTTTTTSSSRSAFRSGSSSVSPLPGEEGEAIRHFKTTRDAEDYLAGVIAKEADKSGSPLTEVERKMLYFTETGWTLPEMKQISTEFDRDYDEGEYEKRIASLICRIRAYFADGAEEERASWEAALRKLRSGDHYLLVLNAAASPARTGLKHQLKVIAAALVFLALGLLNLWFRRWLREH